jgi:hypothetical protein
MVTVISIRARNSYIARHTKSDRIWISNTRTITLTARHSIVFATKTSSGSTPTTTTKAVASCHDEIPTDGRPLAAWHGERSAQLFGKGQEPQQLRGCARAGQQGASRAVRIFQPFFPATPINDSPERVRGRSGTGASECQTLNGPADAQVVRSPRNGSGRLFWRGRAERASRGASTPARPGGATAEGTCLRPQPPVSTNQSRGLGLDSEARAERTDSFFFRPRLAGRPPHKIEKSEAARAPVSSKKASRRDRESSPCCLALSLSLSFHSQRPRLFADSVQKAS